MTLSDLEAAMTARDMQALTIAYVSARGEWQASLRPRGGDGWRIATGATIAEAIARVVGVPARSAAVEEDVFG